ncbi:hypothetical protein [Stackebrandtia nassauensis]|uniref:Uncharacterized protein n=1 Tax=Stackebrandtia nassauensis (strain DSM 44728 / CIP 108903 / NRRL B-16338 / NBRC 102104 / LLR-40K-21) TaxID=446470 RepID=D3Q171_STANL|nr:hypothetical protein [Stackebrandtia nassauensis]ADD45651.1 hypothetical protein Snas_6026 [Stackebrandtia nassauensis DSM 44728]
MRRPATVTIAAVLQLLLAATFTVSVVTALLYGPAAQKAAESEMERQGLPKDALSGESLRFDEGWAGTVPATVIVLILVGLAVGNLRGKRSGRVLTWVLQPLLLVAGAVLVSGQVFLVRGIEAAFAGSGNPALADVDVPALVEAARSAFPAWYPVETWAKFVLVTLGSAVTIVLLALPRSRAFTRR